MITLLTPILVYLQCKAQVNEEICMPGALLASCGIQRHPGQVMAELASQPDEKRPQLLGRAPLSGTLLAIGELARICHQWARLKANCSWDPLGSLVLIVRRKRNQLQRSAIPSVGVI